jgi:hypothetical protein
MTVNYPIPLYLSFYEIIDEINTTVSQLVWRSVAANDLLRAYPT